MALTTFVSQPPVRRRARKHRPDFELLDDAIRQFEAGEHLPAIWRTLEHLLGEAPAPLTEAPLSFVQGSSRIHLELQRDVLQGDRVLISVALVRLQEGAKTTAALRYLLTRISGSGQLHQPRLRGEEVRLEYSDKVRRLHPLKLLEVLRRMPVEADEHDDWMADQFKVSPLEREPVAALTEDEALSAIAIWHRHWADVEELLKESQRKRSMFFLNEVTTYAVFNLRAKLPLAGAVLSRLSESSATFNDMDADPGRRETSLQKCTREMKLISNELLRESLGHALFSISPLADGTKQILDHYFGESDYLSAIERSRSAGKHLDAALAAHSTYAYLLGRFSFRDDIEDALWNALAEASDKSFRDASGILLASGRAILTRLEAEEEENGAIEQNGAPDPSDTQTEVPS